MAIFTRFLWGPLIGVVSWLSVPGWFIVRPYADLIWRMFRRLFASLFEDTFLWVLFVLLGYGEYEAGLGGRVVAGVAIVAIRSRDYDSPSFLDLIILDCFEYSHNRERV